MYASGCAGKKKTDGEIRCWWRPFLFHAGWGSFISSVRGHGGTPLTSWAAAHQQSLIQRRLTGGTSGQMSGFDVQRKRCSTKAELWAAVAAVKPPAWIHPECLKWGSTSKVGEQRMLLCGSAARAMGLLMNQNWLFSVARLKNSFSEIFSVLKMIASEPHLFLHLMAQYFSFLFQWRLLCTTSTNCKYIRKELFNHISSWKYLHI